MDVAENRRSVKYQRNEMVRRVLWMLAAPLYRFSPRPCFGWRRWLLRCFGATVGQQVHVYASARVYFPWNLQIGDWSALGEDVLIYNLGLVEIGSKVTVSHGAQLCAGTHDYRLPDFPLMKPPIRVCDGVWICAGAFIGPGVTIGEGAIVGARAVVMRDVEANVVVNGNPGQVVKRRVPEWRG